MRPPDFATLIPEPTRARLLGVGIDRTTGGEVEVALLVDQKPYALLLTRGDAVRLLDLLLDTVRLLPPDPEPQW